MTSSKETSPTPASVEYRQAEKSINHAVAEMAEENHIEYGSTMERENKPSKKKNWLRRLGLLRK